MTRAALTSSPSLSVFQLLTNYKMCVNRFNNNLITKPIMKHIPIIMSVSCSHVCLWSTLTTSTGYGTATLSTRTIVSVVVI